MANPPSIATSDKPQAAGTVKLVQGEVVAINASGQSCVLQPGDKVFPGDIIQTSEGGAIQIEFANGQVADLGRQASMLVTADLFQPNEAQMDDIARIQELIAQGADPTQVTEASAAGGPEDTGGHRFVQVDYGARATVASGLEPGGANTNSLATETGTVGVTGEKVASGINVGYGTGAANPGGPASPQASETAQATPSRAAANSGGSGDDTAASGENDIGAGDEDDGIGDVVAGGGDDEGGGDEGEGGGDVVAGGDDDEGDGNEGEGSGDVVAGGGDDEGDGDEGEGSGDVVAGGDDEGDGDEGEGGGDVVAGGGDDDAGGGDDEEGEGTPTTVTASVSEDGTSVAGTLTGYSASEPLTQNGTYGSLLVGIDGSWSYAVGDAAQQLRAGETETETFTIISADGSSNVIEVTVTGENDIAVITGASSAEMLETDRAASGNLSVADDDRSESAFQAATISGDYGSFAIDANGDWTYTLAGRAHSLKAGETATETFEVASVDGTTQNVSVSVTGVHGGGNVVHAVEHANNGGGNGINAAPGNSAGGNGDEADGALTGGGILVGGDQLLFGGFDDAQSGDAGNGVGGGNDSDGGVLSLDDLLPDTSGGATLSFESDGQNTTVQLSVGNGNGNGHGHAFGHSLSVTLPGNSGDAHEIVQSLLHKHETNI